MITQLTLDDWPIIKTAIIHSGSSHRIGMSRQSLSTEQYLQYTYSFLRKEGTAIYGFYDNIGIKSMISVVDFSTIPSYGVYNFKNFRTDTIYNPIKNGWTELWNTIFQVQEEKKLYSFYLLRTAEINRLNYKRYHSTYMNGSPKFLNYVRTLEELVPANSHPKWDLHNSLFYFGKTYDHDTMILKFTCKQQYRTGVPELLQQGLLMKED